MLRIKKPDWRRKRSRSSSASFLCSLRTKLLLFCGLFLVLVSLAYYVYQTTQLTLVVPEGTPDIKKTQAAPPVEVAIPAVNLMLPVQETRVINNTWTIAPDAVSHLNESANPTESGPIILYAHNTNEAFGPIKWLSRGEKITVKTADQKTYTYSIVETIITDPQELSVFFKRKQETLYLFTCDGFADLQRFIIVAEPVNEVAT